MNNTQNNAINLCDSPWIMDPITYELALQVLRDATAHHELSESESQKANKAIVELGQQYELALRNYTPRDQQGRIWRTR